MHVTTSTIVTALQHLRRRPHRDVISSMAVPAFDQFIEPLLRYLGEHPSGIGTSDAYEGMARALDLSDQQQQELLPSGTQPIYKNRVGWAHDRLKRHGYSESPG